MSCRFQKAEVLPQLLRINSPCNTRGMIHLIILYSVITHTCLKNVDDCSVIGYYQKSIIFYLHEFFESNKRSFCRHPSFNTNIGIRVEMFK